MRKKLSHFWGGGVPPGDTKDMKRRAMKALAELEEALIDVGVPDEDVYQLVDRFEEEVEELLDEVAEDGDEGESDSEPENAAAQGKRDAYRPG